MKWLILIGGCGAIILSLFLLQPALEESKLFHNGEKIQATVTFVPKCNTTRGIHFMEFEFNNKFYKKRLQGNLCQTLIKGDKITLITNKDRTKFMFEIEKPLEELGALLFIFLFGIICVGYSIWMFKKMKLK